MNRHLNLFYCYGSAGLEDNITRALVLTLKRMEPVNCRLFIQELLRRAGRNTHDFRPLAQETLDFDLQCDTPDPDQRLGGEEGLLLGITYSGTQNLNLIGSTDSRTGRIDACIRDSANLKTLLVESKKNDALYRDQIQRHLNGWFEPKTDPDKVFLQQSWTQLAEILGQIQAQSRSAVESDTIQEFLDYLNDLTVLQFNGFNASDFREFNNSKLHKCLVYLVEGMPDLQLRPYEHNYQIWFSDIPNVNLYAAFDYEIPGIKLGIVYGSGKKWQAQIMRNLLRDSGRLEVFRNQINEPCLSG